MDIREALSNLDTLDDTAWTDEGLPRIEVMEELLGFSVTRQEITDAAPDFSRSNPIVSEEQETEEIVEKSYDEFDHSLFADNISAEVFVHEMMKISPTDLESLKEILEKRHSSFTADLKAIENKINANRIFLHHVKSRIAREIPDLSDQEANRRYIQSQQELRMKRHAATSALLKAVDLKSLDPRAPIDRAMARKNKRGSERPNVPKKG